MNRDLRDSDWYTVPGDEARPLLVDSAKQARIMSDVIQENPWPSPAFDLYDYAYGDGPQNMRAASAFYYRAIERGIFDNECEWMMQEKYDGWYVIWDGARLLKKSGQPLQSRRTTFECVQTWENILSDMAPSLPIVGEVHAGRGRVRSIWKGLRESHEANPKFRMYLTLFDIPFATLYTNRQRYQRLCALFVTGPGPGYGIDVAPCIVVRTAAEASRAFRSIVYNEGDPHTRIDEHDRLVMAEGVVLRMAGANYRPGVTRTMLKLKPIALVCVTPHPDTPLLADPYLETEGSREDTDKVKRMADDEADARDRQSVCCTRVLSNTGEWTHATHQNIRKRILQDGASYTNGLAGSTSGVRGSVLPRSVAVSFAPREAGYAVEGTLRLFPSCDRFVAYHRNTMGLFDPYRTTAGVPIYAWCHLYEVCVNSTSLLIDAATKPRLRLSNTILYIAGDTDVHPTPGTLRSAVRKAVPVTRMKDGFKSIYPQERDWWPTPLHGNEWPWFQGERLAPYMFTQEFTRGYLSHPPQPPDHAGEPALADKPSLPRIQKLWVMLLLLSFRSGSADTDTDPVWLAVNSARTKQKWSWALLDAAMPTLWGDAGRAMLDTALREMVDVVAVVVAIYTTVCTGVYTKNKYQGSVTTETQAGLLALRRGKSDVSGVEWIRKLNECMDTGGHLAVAFRQIHKKGEGAIRVLDYIGDNPKKSIYNIAVRPGPARLRIDGMRECFEREGTLGEVLGRLHTYSLLGTYECGILDRIGSVVGVREASHSGRRFGAAAKALGHPAELTETRLRRQAPGGTDIIALLTSLKTIHLKTPTAGIDRGVVFV
jgi:hypothetical protein